jgi:hypothetical protein
MILPETQIYVVEYSNNNIDGEPGRKRPWLYLTKQQNLYREGLKKSIKNFIQGNKCCPDILWNQVLASYENSSVCT